MNRQVLRHYRTSVLNISPSPDSLENGEIGINYASDGETLFIKNTNNEIAKFKDDKFYQKALSNISNKIFVGTQEEYKTAYADGKISVGALVVIINDDEINTSGVTSTLGQAILGVMLLGK